MLTMRHLELIAVLHKHRHFGRAAAALGVSQPSLTRSLKGLEDVLGVAIFDRDGVSPTIFGHILLRRGKALLADRDELLHEVAMVKGVNVGELAVSMGPYAADISGHRSAGLLAARYPNLAITVSVKNWPGAIDDVVTGRADLAIADITQATANPHVLVEPIRACPLRFFCSPGHPLLNRKPLRLDDLLDFPWAGPSVPGSLHKALPPEGRSYGFFEPGLDRYRPRILVETFAAAKDIVAAGHVISAAAPPQIRRELDEGRFVLLPLALPWPKLNYGFITKRGRTSTPAARAMMEIVRATEKALPAETAAI